MSTKDESEHRELRELVASLPKEYRLPLVLYYFDERDVKTVAEIMNISVSGAYSRIREATGQLHQLYTDERGHK